MTQHQEGIILWEVPSGRARCTLRDPAIRLARQTFPLGEGVATVRSGSDTPGIHNAVLLEFSTSDCTLQARRLVPARDPVVAAAGAGSRAVFTIEGIRATTRSTTVQAQLPGAPLTADALHVSSDGRWIAWAGADTTRANELSRRTKHETRPSTAIPGRRRPVS